MPIARAQSLAARKRIICREFFFFFSFSILFLLFQLCQRLLRVKHGRYDPATILTSLRRLSKFPKKKLKNTIPGLESNLQIGQKLKLPLRSYLESKPLEEELGKKDERIGKLESKSSDLENKIASAESQLRWHPIWLWGFWISFGIIAFIVSGAYWIFRQTHPQVFEQPHDRSIRDLRESQIRARSSSFPHDEEGASSRGGKWQLSLKPLPTHH